jgi:zinc transporter ZupT
MVSNSMMRFLDEVHEEEHNEGNDKPWGDVIAGSLIIMLVTFSGVLLTSSVGCFQRMRGTSKEDASAFWSTMHRIAIPSFAGGALLATVVFLLIPEAFELLAHAEEEEEDHDEDHADERRYLEEEDHEEHEEGAQWRFGVALLCGFLLPILISTLFPSPDTSACEPCLSKKEEEEVLSASAVSSEQEEDEADTEAEKKHVAGDGEKAVVKVEDSLAKETTAATFEHHQGSSINWGLAMSILIGDGFHNFTDGIFLGNAFVLCSRDIAYTLVATTVYHELAQEIADFALLTHHCGMSTRQALTYNFLSGFSVMLGAVLIVALDLSDVLTGSLLSMSAGVYIYIAATECIPRIQAAQKSVADTMTFLLCFIIGAVPIGLVLLNHGHCEPEGEHEEDH